MIDRSIDLAAEAVVLAIAFAAFIWAWGAVTPPRHRGRSLVEMAANFVVAEAIIFGVIFVSPTPILSIVAGVALAAAVGMYARHTTIRGQALRAGHDGIREVRK